MEQKVCEMESLCLPYKQQTLGMRLLYPLLFGAENVEKGEKCCNTSLNQPAN